VYSRRTGLILGFHGCDKSVADSIVPKKDQSLRRSTNAHDWLGHGIYFWENNLKRAIEFATDLKNNPRSRQRHTITTPAAVGAIINLGYCLDLLDSDNFSIVKQGYDSLTTFTENLPVNSGKDQLSRNLDCAVFQAMHKMLSETGHLPFDSIRGVFWEGNPVYEGAGWIKTTSKYVL
jgi:hypothetical protein